VTENVTPADRPLDRDDDLRRAAEQIARALYRVAMQAADELEREGTTVAGYRGVPRKHPAAARFRDASAEFREWLPYLQERTTEDD